MKPALKNTLEWDVRTAPVSTPAGKLSGMTALLRNDTDDFLGIVTSAYNLFSNRNFIRLNDMLVRSGRFILEGYYEYNNGKKVMSYLREKSAVKLSGHEAFSYLVLGNSHDGTTSFCIGAANMIIRCKNQFYQTAEVLRLCHSKPIIVDNVKVSHIISSYDLGNYSLDKYFELFKKVPIKDNAVPELIAEIFRRMKYDSSLEVLERPMAKRMLASINSEVDALGSNLFGLFNGITHFTSHNAASEQKSFNSILGSPARINQFAFDYCKSMI